MFKLKLDNVIKVVYSDFEKEKLLKQGYVLIKEEVKEIEKNEITEEIQETEATEEIQEETEKSNKKGGKKNEQTS